MRRLVLLALLLLAPAAARAETTADHVFTTADGRERDYRLTLPKGGGSGALPLIIVLHGTYGTAEKMERHLGFEAYADRYTVAIAYPNAYHEPRRRQTLRWNDGRGTLASSAAGIDDVAFMRALVADIGRHITLDKRRVYVTGASNGGMMAYRIGCEAADLVAGIAPVIGAVAQPIAASCKPSRAIPVLAIAGVDDPIVPFSGGAVCKDVRPGFCEGGDVIGAEASLARFAAAARCGGAPQAVALPPRKSDGTSILRVAYPACAGGARVIGLWVRGGGHAWPPLPSQLGPRRSGRSTANLDATDVIVRFFLDPAASIP